MPIERKFHSGYASVAGTTFYKEYAIKKGVDPLHFKQVEDLYLTSLGMGTYLGNQSSVDDENIEKSLSYCVSEGCTNVIDTAINYRSMLSEKCIGRALTNLFSKKILNRNNVFICTKNGYATNDGLFRKMDINAYLKAMYIDKGIIQSRDISSSYNILNPDYISNCIDKSLCNMGIETIDLVYVHNSYESWFDQVDVKTYMDMLSKVFQVYENYKKKGKIRFYGMATWNCFTAKQKDPNYLSLSNVVSLAREIGGETNGFKFIQLPFNYYMKEPYLLKNQKVPDTTAPVSLLDAAAFHNIHVFTSIPLFQGKLLSAPINDVTFEGLPNQSSKLLQFVRSTPGIVAPLVGQKQLEHTKQNTVVSKHPPVLKSEIERLLELQI